MKNVLLLSAFGYFAVSASSQSNDVSLAAIAWEKGHFENAWDNANAALQSPQKLDKAGLYKAYAIRGMAGTRLAYSALTKGEAQDTQRYAGMALQAYHDFKEVLNTKDTAWIHYISPEFYK